MKKSIFILNAILAVFAVLCADCKQAEDPGKGSKSFIVTFDKNNSDTGSTEANPQTLTVTRPSTTVGSLPEPPTRLGYVFGSWNTEANGSGTEFTANTGVNSNITVFAQWGENPYYVKYNANGGQGDMADSTFFFGIEQHLSANSFTRTGYTFAGWSETAVGTVKYADEELVLDLASVTDEILVLFAQWEGIPSTVTFDKNNSDTDSTEADPQTRTVTHPETTAVLPAQPVRPGYAFTSWNTQADGSGTEFTASTTVTENITVYAQWTGISFTVTFYKNNSDVGSSEADPQTRTVTRPATTVILPEPPERTGYTFNGWNTKDDGSGTAFTETTRVDDSIIVYALWKLSEFAGDNGIEMLWIPGGTFELGKELGTAGLGDVDVMPTSTVTLTGFYIGKYQVTQDQYQAVMGSNPSYFLSSPAAGEVQGRRPVDSLSWYDAIVFCNKLSIIEGLSPAYKINNSTNPGDWGPVPASSDAAWDAVEIVSGSKGYRLPTEAQWEYAAKGGASQGTYTYSGSNTIGDVAWYDPNSNSMTHEVGKKQANVLGLYDMCGNVWEWCWDWWGAYTNTPKTNPEGASSGDGRIIRGGSFYEDEANNIRSVNRHSSYLGWLAANLGFRLACPE